MSLPPVAIHAQARVRTREQAELRATIERESRTMLGQCRIWRTDRSWRDLAGADHDRRCLPAQAYVRRDSPHDEPRQLFLDTHMGGVYMTSRRGN